MPIALTPPFFFLLAMMAVGLLVVAALWDEIQGQLERWDVSREQIASCPKCQISMLANRFESIVRCPRCGILCSKNKR
jgi:uncharacterized paraquat-inducible protein A